MGVDARGFRPLPSTAFASSFSTPVDKSGDKMCESPQGHVDDQCITCVQRRWIGCFRRDDLRFLLKWPVDRSLSESTGKFEG